MALPATEREEMAGLVGKMASGDSISRPPSTLDVFGDRVFRGLTRAFAGLTIFLVLYIVLEIGGKAAPAMQKYGLSFMTSTTWDVNKARFGVLPEIWGTLEFIPIKASVAMASTARESYVTHSRFP
jgi:ABC-type phosphate transport system permease subunit